MKQHREWSYKNDTKIKSLKVVKEQYNIFSYNKKRVQVVRCAIVLNYF